MNRFSMWFSANNTALEPFQTSSEETALQKFLLYFFISLINFSACMAIACICYYACKNNRRANNLYEDDSEYDTGAHSFVGGF